MTDRDAGGMAADDRPTGIIPRVVEYDADPDRTGVIPRVSESDEDPDRTGIIPAVTDARTDSDETAVIRRVTGSDAATTVLPRIGAADEHAARERDDSTRRPRGKDRRGPRIVKLRPVQTAGGYRSIYAEATRTTAGTVIRTVVRGTGELLISCGLIVLLFAAYELWGKTVEIHHHQDQLEQQLTQAWSAPPATGGKKTTAPTGLPYPGGALARLYVPAIQKQPWVVVQGVEPRDIRFAPGHYPNSALPGQVGNFAVAGHRSPGIFRYMENVRPSDVIVVETRDMWYVYQVYANIIVTPTAIEQVSPVPPGAHPGDRLVTLTTCNPWWDNYQRMIVHGRLIREQPRSAGVPAEVR